MIKKILVAVTLLVTTAFASGTYAASCSQSINQLSDLDKATKQAMIVQCEQIKLNAPSQDEIDIEKIDRWSEISLKFAKAIGVAAKEFGVAVNEFLGTPAGKLTAAIIVWKSLEVAIGSITIFLVWFAISTPMFYYFRKGVMVTENIVVKDSKGNEKVREVLASWGKQTDTAAALYFFSYCIQLIGLIVVLCI